MTAKGLIFDMDGVLVDTAEFHIKSWEELAKESGVVTGDEFFKSNFGKRNEEILPEFFRRKLTEEEIKQYSGRKESIFRKLIRGHVSLMSGVNELIRTAYHEGWIIGVGSSAPAENIRLVIVETGIGEYLSGITSGDEVKEGKPSPEVFLKSAAKINVPAHCCVVIEDTPVGIHAAVNAGMKCIAVTNSHPRENLKKADIVVDDLSELKLSDIEALLV